MQYAPQFSASFKSMFLLRFDIWLSCLITTLNSMLCFLQHQLTSLLGRWGEEHSFLLLLNIKGSLFYSISKITSSTRSRQATLLLHQLQTGVKMETLKKKKSGFAVLNWQSQNLR